MTPTGVEEETEKTEKAEKSPKWKIKYVEIFSFASCILSIPLNYILNCSSQGIDCCEI